MIIQEATISVTYNKVSGLKKAYYNNEETLKQHFNEATILPVPDDAADDFPRILLTTLHEHSQMSISPAVTTFHTTFDNGFENDWKSCEKYLREKMTVVFDFLNLLTGNQYKYIGVINNILFDNIPEKGAEELSKTLLKSEKIANIFDVNIKYTFVERDTFYVNIMLQNARIFSKQLDPFVAGSFCKENQLAESIGAVLDVNDRYGFNCNTDYKSSSTVLDDILKILQVLISEKLDSLIFKGEY